MITGSSYAEVVMGTWRCPPTPQATGCVTASVEEAAGRAQSRPWARLHQGCAAVLSILLIPNSPVPTLFLPWFP